MWQILEGFSVNETEDTIILSPGVITLDSVGTKEIPTTLFPRKSGVMFLQINEIGDIYHAPFHNREHTLIHAVFREGDVGAIEVNTNIKFAVEALVGPTVDSINNNAITSTKTLETIVTDNKIILSEQPMLISTVYVDGEGDLKDGWTHAARSTEIILNDFSLNGRKVFITYAV